MNFFATHIGKVIQQVTGKFITTSASPYDWRSPQNDNLWQDNIVIPEGFTYGEVTSPTGRVWMDRNLGASQVATSSTDSAAYGDLYQWGRATDGHEKRDSGTTTTLNGGSADAPVGTSVWRVPTYTEWIEERNTWPTSDIDGAFNSILKIPAAGFRRYSDSNIINEGVSASLWSNSVNGTESYGLSPNSLIAPITSERRSRGDTVRLIKEQTDWDIESYSYSGIYMQSEGIQPRGVFFKPDGTKMYDACYGDFGMIYQYTLSTSWDLDTATYDNVSFDNQEFNIEGIFFKPDGTKMYEVSSTYIYQYSLSTPWDLNSMSYDNKSVTSQNTEPTGVFFKSDGTKMYEIGKGTENKIYQYTLSTSWDLNTATYDNVSVNTQHSIPNGMFIKPDGTKMYETGGSSPNEIYQYTLGTAWDLNTASYDNRSISTQNTQPQGIFFEPSGNRMYEVGDGSSVYGSSSYHIYQYNYN